MLFIKRKWKKRCPIDCPGRDRIKEGSPGEKVLTLQIKKKEELLSPTTENGPNFPVLPQQKLPIPHLEAERTEPVIEMIVEAVEQLGRRAKLEDIFKYFENHFQTFIESKKNWKEVVYAYLQVFFVEVAGEDRRTGNMWMTINETSRNSRVNISKLFDGYYFQVLREAYSNPPVSFKGISYMNKDHQLTLDARTLTHNGPVHSMNWSNDGNFLVTAGNSLAIWNTLNWNKVELPKSNPSDLYFAACFSSDDKKIIAGGKTENYVIKVK